jgi:CPA1 family monovalent cation:H+ antiporter
LPGLADEQGTDPDVIDRLRREVEEHLEVLRADGEGNGDEPAIRHDQQYSRLRLAVLQHKRDTVLRLRDERRIDDTVLRLVQTKLDIEEVRLTRRELLE